MSSASSNGFVRKSSAPAARPSRMSPG
jgi:hypothetical protein